MLPRRTPVGRDAIGEECLMRDMTRCGWEEIIVPREAAEEIKKALVEGQDEKIIRIPPDDLARQVTKAMREKKVNEMYAALRVPKEVYEAEQKATALQECFMDKQGRVRPTPETPGDKPIGVMSAFADHEPVFCGTSGDKEYLKDRASRSPIGILPERICVRCYRLAGGRFDGEWLCPACLEIEANDAPATLSQRMNGMPVGFDAAEVRPPTSA